MKKVCFQIPTINAGGIETYLLRFIQYANNRFDITVIVRGSLNGELFEDYTKTGVKLVSLPLKYVNIRSIYKYYKFIKSEKNDTVCDFTGNFSGIPILVSKIIGIENRITFYRSGSNHFGKNYFKRTYNFIMNLFVYLFSTNILANSVSGLNYFFPYRSSNDSRFKVIQNGFNLSDFDKQKNEIDIKKIFDIPNNAFVIGHSGRYNIAKNHEFMIKVAQQLISIDKHFYFVFCGKDTEMLQTNVENLGIEKNVRLLGYRKDVLKIMSRVNLFYFPSLTEGQPNALIEAMIMGIPIVASDIEPIKECIPELYHQQLVNPTDVDANVQLLLMTKLIKPDELNLSEWAKTIFSAEKRFEEFAEVFR
jgi:glycosyltransferase involved in cell wall biosynthesis